MAEDEGKIECCVPAEDHSEMSFLFFFFFYLWQCHTFIDVVWFTFSIFGRQTVWFCSSRVSSAARTVGRRRFQTERVKRGQRSAQRWVRVHILLLFNSLFSCFLHIKPGIFSNIPRILSSCHLIWPPGLPGQLIRGSWRPGIKTWDRLSGVSVHLTVALFAHWGDVMDLWLFVALLFLYFS